MTLTSLKPMLKKITLLLGTVIILGFGGVTLAKYQENILPFLGLQRIKATMDDTAVIQELGQHILLPNEEPTIATVTDKEKLASQPFFAQSENGDKVIIYTGVKKAILYRPSEKKIVDIAPLITDPKNTENGIEKIETLPEVQKVSITLLNGSTKIGITNQVETQLTGVFEDLTVEKKEPAQKNDYPGTLVVDVTGKNAEAAQKIAQELNGTVGVLPESETAPTTDILVIVGNN